MRRLLTLVLCLWPALVMGTPQNAPFFYRLGKGGQRPSYLLGTLQTASTRLLPPFVLERLNELEAFYLEALPEQILESYRWYTYRTSSPLLFFDRPLLSEVLGADVVQKLIGLKSPRLRHARNWEIEFLKPAFILQVLMMDRMGAQLHPRAVQEFSKNNRRHMGWLSRVAGQMDAELLARAQQKGLEPAGLETFEDQLQHFTEVPISEVIRTIERAEQGLNYPETIKALNVMLGTTEAYAQGDLARLTFEIDRLNSPEEEKWAALRRRTWAQKIAAAAAQKPTFFAVGIGDLITVQSDNLLKDLRREGFEIKRQGVCQTALE